MKDVKKVESEWDKRKIFLFLISAIILLGLGFELKSFISDANQVRPPVSSKESVQGASTEVHSPPVPNIQKSIQEQIGNLKNEAQNINLVDIATSSPQVQKVINDLRDLQNYPSTQLKDTCQKICNSL